MSVAKGWRFGSDANFDVAWSPNKVSLTIKQNANYAQRFERVFKDGGIEIEAQPLAEAVTYGISFRSSGEDEHNEYFFFVTTDGFYFLYKRVDGQPIKPPLAEGPSPYLHQGLAKNRLGVLAEGATISLFINGRLVKTVTDTTFSSGAFKIMANNLSAERVQVDFFRVTVFSAEQAKVALTKPDNSTAAALAGVLFHDDFSSEQVVEDNGWKLVAEADQERVWSPGKLTWSVKQRNLLQMTRPNIPFLSDFGVEVEAQPENIPGTEYGILIRFGGTSQEVLNFYYFTLSVDGQYYMGKSVGGKYAERAPVLRTASPHIKTGASKNRLGVLAEGSTLSLYVNGALVKTVVDDSIASGAVGLFVMTGNNAPASVTFTSMTVLSVERARAEWETTGVLFESNFSSPQACAEDEWTVGSTATSDVFCAANKLTVAVKQKDTLVTSYPYGTYKDFAVQVETQAITASNTEYGIVFRYGGERGKRDFYLFGVSAEGNYFATKTLGGSAVTTIVGRAPSSLVQPGASQNRLGVLAEGSTFSLYVNGARVTSVFDDSIERGSVGVFVQSRGGAARVDFSRMTAITVAKAKAEWGTPGVLFHDDFSSEAASRAKGLAFKSSAVADFTWSPGKFTVTLKKDQTAIELVEIPAGALGDFGAEIEAEPADEPRTEYGLFFRLSEGGTSVSHYTFGVTNDGYYHLFKKINGKWAAPDPLPRTYSPYLKPPPAKNRLGVLAEGKTISLFINGHLVQTISDDSIKSGIIAAYVGAGTGRTSVAFTRMTVYTLARAKTELGAHPEAITPAPRPTAAATPPPRPTATTPPGILFHDDFSSEQVSRSKGWGFGAETSADYTWSPNRLTITTKKKRTILWATVPAGVQKDFGVEIEAQPEDKPGIEYGIMLRLGGSADARSYYLFGVTTEGKYYLYKKVGGEWADQDPVSDTSSTFIKPGAAKNRLGVLAEGARISLYINGNLVKTITDDSMASGSVAVFVDSRESERAAVAFSRVTLYTVAKAKTELGKR